MRPCGSVVVHYNRRVDQPEASAMKAKYSWTWAREYSHLSAELAASSGRDFEKQALPFIRAAWEAAILPKALGGVDQQGIDAMLWGDHEPHPLVVQFKGFEVSDLQLGRSQIRNCKSYFEVPS
jgi:hypothetical protein